MPRRRVVGIGTAGINILDHLLESGIQGVDSNACPTDLYRLACRLGRRRQLEFWPVSFPNRLNPAEHQGILILAREQPGSAREIQPSNL